MICGPSGVDYGDVRRNGTLSVVDLRIILVIVKSV